MSNKSEELRLDRERTLGLLYELEMKQVPAPDLIEQLATPITDHIAQALRGIDETRPQLDELIAAQSTGWDIERMAVIDLCVLRFGVWELLNRPNLSVAVIVNEAIDLSKKFSTDDSGKFVNGVLDAIARKVRS